LWEWGKEKCMPDFGRKAEGVRGHLVDFDIDKKKLLKLILKEIIRDV
jgi:hypothetical protein